MPLNETFSLLRAVECGKSNARRYWPIDRQPNFMVGWIPKLWTTLAKGMSLSGLTTTRPLSGFLSPKLRKQRHRPTNSQISLKPEGDVFVAGSDMAQLLLALCHAAVSDPWFLEGGSGN